MDKLIVIAGVFVVAVAGLFVMALLMALPTYILWNWLVPTISHGSLAEITLFQAWGINFLCALLFKSNTTCTCKKED